MFTPDFCCGQKLQQLRRGIGKTHHESKRVGPRHDHQQELNRQPGMNGFSHKRLRFAGYNYRIIYC
jgi:hypothetical protein